MIPRILSLICLLVAIKASGISQFYPDNLTSTSIQTDKNGNQIQNYLYSAFGQSRYTQSTNLFKVSRRYTGQVLDEGTGLYYYNARYYDPNLGRFTQPDDIIPDLANPQSYNRYAYCVNNPLRFTDPDGHGPIDDALFNTDTIKSSWQLMTMHDTGWNKAWEIPVAVIGIGAGVADAGFNVVSLGGKGLVTGGIKEGVKVGVKELTKEGAEKAGTKIVTGAVEKSAATTTKDVGRAGKQARLKEMANDPNVSSADRGWIKNEERQIEYGNRDTIRNPPGKDLAHERGREAAKGYSYEHSNLQSKDLHRTQHKFDDFGRSNKERPVKPSE